MLKTLFYDDKNIKYNLGFLSTGFLLLFLNEIHMSQITYNATETMYFFSLLKLYFHLNRIPLSMISITLIYSLVSLKQGVKQIIVAIFLR